MALTCLTKDILVDICSDLDSDDMDNLKFLMKDVAGLHKLMPATIALDLFSAIENNKTVALLNGRFLAECFELMGRTDLVRRIGLNPTQVEKEMGQTNYSVRPFRILLYKISEDLASDDVELLASFSLRVFKLTRQEKESIKSAFDLFVLLEKRGIIEVAHTSPLKEMVKSLENRGDLVDLVDEYQVIVPDNSGHTGSRTIPDYPDGGVSLHSTSHLAQSRRPQNINIGPSVPYYEMTSNPRGICVIINNKKFKKMKAREGTDVDQVRLEATFKKLGFTVRVFKDLTVKDMAGVMKDISIMDHSKFNALVVCVLSHGGENFIYRMDDRKEKTGNRQRLVQGDGDRPIQGNFVYGVDDKPIPIRYLTMYFQSSKCKTLANKPKLFFIQACQGEDMQTGVLLSSDFQKDGPSVDESIDLDVAPVSENAEETDAAPHASDNQKVIPDESDFLLGYATVFGYVSYRSRSQGSFYVKSLTENLDKHADTLDLQALMVKVNHDVSENNIELVKGEQAKKQVPMTQITLRKQLFFSPDNLK
ncbi:caspase-8-like [Mytilus californianus]|uniref:caspase-8-like n=1 Tax=Mytilus californianus TaxID=6549 RepID=UPI00224790F2|nr:caspase-8-like [Mytilus californianus]